MLRDKKIDRHKRGNIELPKENILLKGIHVEILRIVNAHM